MSSPAAKFHVAVAPDFGERYDRSVLDGISNYIQETNHWSVYIPPDPTHRVAMLDKWSGDGIIANVDDPKVALLVRRKRVHVVGFGGGNGVTSKFIHFMATDNAMIGRYGAEHLLECGLTHFGYCAMPLSYRNQPWSEDRCRAFRESIEAAGHSCTTFRVTQAISNDWTLLLEALCGWLRSQQTPIGIMAAYDLMALHVLEACHELGLRVPDEVAVLGVDNDKEVCELTVPPLSSIEQGGVQLGYRAAVLLDRLMQGESVTESRRSSIPPVGVIKRRSTDVMAIDDEAVATAMRFIKDYACTGIRVTDVVKQTNISRVTLENRFKTIIGHTMHCEIKHIQLECVRELLRTTDLPINQIAERSGFEYPQYLSNLFQRTFHQTLGEYRHQMRGARHAKSAAK